MQPGGWAAEVMGGYSVIWHAWARAPCTVYQCTIESRLNHDWSGVEKGKRERGVDSRLARRKQFYSYPQRERARWRWCGSQGYVNVSTVSQSVSVTAAKSRDLRVASCIPEPPEPERERPEVEEGPKCDVPSANADDDT